MFRLELVCCEGAYLLANPQSIRVEFVDHSDKEMSDRLDDEQYDGSVEVYYVLGDSLYIWTQEVDVTEGTGLDIVREIYMAIDAGINYVSPTMRGRWM